MIKNSFHTKYTCGCLLSPLTDTFWKGFKIGSERWSHTVYKAPENMWIKRLWGNIKPCDGLNTGPWRPVTPQTRMSAFSLRDDHLHWSFLQRDLSLPRSVTSPPGHTKSLRVRTHFTARKAFPGVQCGRVSWHVPRCTLRCILCHQTRQQGLAEASAVAFEVSGTGNRTTIFSS